MDTNNMRAHAGHTKTGPPGHTPEPNSRDVGKALGDIGTNGVLSPNGPNLAEYAFKMDPHT